MRILLLFVLIGVCRADWIHQEPPNNPPQEPCCKYEILPATGAQDPISVFTAGLFSGMTTCLTDLGCYNWDWNGTDFDVANEWTGPYFPDHSQLFRFEAISPETIGPKRGDIGVFCTLDRVGGAADAMNGPICLLPAENVNAITFIGEYADPMTQQTFRVVDATPVPEPKSVWLLVGILLTVGIFRELLRKRGLLWRMRHATIPPCYDAPLKS